MKGPSFRFGDAGIRDAVERCYRDPAHETVLRDNVRRRIVRIPGPGGPLLIKQFRGASGRHRVREFLKSLVASGPADKELRALRRIGAAAPVAPALAAGRLPNGDRFIVYPFVEAGSVDEQLADTDRRLDALARIGHAVRALHATGTVHRDLHRENLLVGEEQVVIVDLQNARRDRSLRARLRDIADFEFSLRGRISQEERRGFERAVLGTAAEAQRERIEALLHAAAYEHGAGRTRRAMRPGRRFARWKRASGRGLRRRDVAPEVLERWLAAHHEGTGASLPIKREGRVSITRVEDANGAVVIKETGSGLGRALADLFRGSPGRRAWRAGHGLLARDVAAAEPLAFAERRRLGLPLASLVVLEAVDGPDGVGACRRPEALEAQLDLITRLHHMGIDHGDLKATNWIHGGPDGRATLVDLEGVRFRRALSDENRIEGLAQWNASLPDEVSSAARARLFERYVERVPFRGDPARIRREVVRRSLARAHRWTGRDCDAAAD